MDVRLCGGPLTGQSRAQSMEQRRGVSQANLGGLATLTDSSERTAFTDGGKRHAPTHRTLAEELSMQQGNP